MNIIPFDSNKGLPSYLKTVDVAALNADLTSHAGGGFPVLSIKGKQFAVVRDGERELLMNPKDPDSAASSLDVVLVKANKGVSKVFYAKGYDPDASDKQKPTCYSPDGVAPAADSQEPQASKCAGCKHNQWGSRVSDKGATKGKACQDSVRMAVAPAGRVNDPMLLRVPPASIRGLGEYGQLLAKRGVAYNMVVTKIAFDVTAESPKLTFKPVGFLDEGAYAEVCEVADSDIVANILGGLATQAEAPGLSSEEIYEKASGDGVREQAKAQAERVIAKTKAVSAGEVESAVQAAEVAPPPKPKAAAKKVEVKDDFEVDLGGIEFDD